MSEISTVDYSTKIPNNVALDYHSGDSAKIAACLRTR